MLFLTPFLHSTTATIIVSIGSIICPDPGGNRYKNVRASAIKYQDPTSTMQNNNVKHDANMHSSTSPSLDSCSSRASLA